MASIQATQSHVPVRSVTGRSLATYVGRQEILKRFGSQSAIVPNAIFVKSSHRCTRLEARKSSLAVVSARRILIVNTPSGGHAPIGTSLSKLLSYAGYDVTLFICCEPGSSKLSKAPFKYLDELRRAGVRDVCGSPEDIARSNLGSFDAVVDNNGKELKEVQPIIDWAVSNWCKQYIYVSSCGIYKETNEPPHIEGDAIKRDASHAIVENYLLSSPINGSIFRPQYICGEGKEKACEEWFFDRLVRGRPLPIPGSGMQMTNVAHHEDLGSMIAASIGNPNAYNEIFNCVAAKAIHLDGLVALCAEAAGVSDYKIVHYDPNELGIKKAFPFRNYHFYAEPRNAVEKLGWAQVYMLKDTLRRSFYYYEDNGGLSKNVDFSLDDQILDKLQGHIKVDGFKVSADFRLSAGQLIQLKAVVQPDGHDNSRASAPLSEALRSKIERAVIHSHPHFLAVNKPAGIATHGGAGVGNNHLLGGLQSTSRDGGLCHALNEDHRYRLVHRLDFGTSGAVVIARGMLMARLLSFTFARRKVEKVYIAIVCPPPEFMKGEISLPISTYGPFKHLAKHQKAITQYAVANTSKTHRLAVVLARPLTGRRHQIRIHFSKVGCPILGDSKYDGKEKSRLMLHSYQLKSRIRSTTVDTQFKEELRILYEDMQREGRSKELGQSDQGRCTVDIRQDSYEVKVEACLTGVMKSMVESICSPEQLGQVEAVLKRMPIPPIKN